MADDAAPSSCVACVCGVRCVRSLSSVARKSGRIVARNVLHEALEAASQLVFTAFTPCVERIASSLKISIPDALLLRHEKRLHALATVFGDSPP